MKTLFPALVMLASVMPAAAQCCAGCGYMECETQQTEASETADAIAAFIKDKRARIGVAWTEGDKLLTVNDSPDYPMMSVFKLHVAVAVLRKMAREGTSPDMVLHIGASRMQKDTYSPLLRLHPDADFDISIRELLRYSVAESDNNACDILIDYAGGVDVVSREMRSVGVSDFRITETEATMHADTSRCRNNTSSPSSVARLLRDIFEGDILTGGYARLMQQTLLMTTTGADKIKAGLSPDMTLAHKTGSSDRSPEGVKTGDNDAGVITLPDGRRCYLAVFIKDSAESDTVNAATIAGITKIILSRTMRREAAK